MKRFSFSLQSVHDHRTVLRELAERELAEATAALSSAEQSLDEATRERNAALNSYSALLESGRVDPDRLSMHIGHIALLVQRENQARGRVDQLNRKREARRQAVIEAARDEKAITKLRDRHRARHEGRAARIEQTDLDEIATLGFARRVE